MKAVLYPTYGPVDVMKVEEVEKPVPKNRQVLVKVHASSINAMDWRGLKTPALMRVMGGGLTRPKDARTGNDLAGQVEAVGENVTRFRPGDEVFGCARGAFAEYVLAGEANLTLKPAAVSFEQAAAVPIAGLTALQGLRCAGGVRPGQKVLIQGASGGVGVFAVQLAKCDGAEVTAVCSPRNQQMARTLGADRVIDYTREDFTRAGPAYDLIFAVNGYHPLAAYRRALNPGGVYVCAGGTLAQIFQAMLLGPWMSRGGEKQFRSLGMAQINPQDLATLGEYLEAGKIAPVIDRSYPLSQVVEALRYVIDQHAQGKVVIQVA